MSYPLWEESPTEPCSGFPPDVGARLRPLVPGLARSAVEAVRRRAQSHGPPLEPGDAEAWRELIVSAVYAFIERVEGDRLLGDPTRVAEEFRAFGADEARQGRTLERLHAGTRAAVAIAWRRLAITDTFTRREVAVLGEALFAFQEELISAAAEGHSEARGAEGDRRQRARSLLLEALLDGADPASVPPLAQAARWRVPERVAVALLLPEGTAWVPAPPSDILVDAERDDPHAVVPDPDGPGRTRLLERALRGCTAVLGPSVDPGRAPVSLARARRLAALVRAGVVPGGGVVRWSDHLSTLLLAHDTALVAELARERLAPLERLRQPQRDRMADTLLAWLESGFNANGAAERLRVHPQTVRYRIRRLEELFGPRMREPDARFELELVLRARRLLGPLESI
ncbi:PucR family transcriptional regulator [Nocardiopsis sp. CNR-923]|uniref:PucR family transcriptional regulator n=1 Tax=Nocardiopsis sp. CNR-923 TaxID=1904965 RepID=UPI00095BB182|nr:helix-turn-helix domain-containing protein [Nocardiopsis sp. CNR-923]OLT25046.1 PucR family transcriptional regulator [Nocardiopsis sp. CNR-923]